MILNQPVHWEIASQTLPKYSEGVKSGYTAHTKPALFVSRITPVPKYILHMLCGSSLFLQISCRSSVLKAWRFLDGATEGGAIVVVCNCARQMKIWLMWMDTIMAAVGVSEARWRSSRSVTTPVCRTDHDQHGDSSTKARRQLDDISTTARQRLDDR